MKPINKIFIFLIVVVYTLAFTMKPLGAIALAGVGLETEAETKTEDMTETEFETEAPPYTPDEFYEMSHVISAEAGDCNWDMMVGVGYVVMNRKNAKCWPDTIYDVIHQPGQYTCLDNGTFYNEPTEMACKAADYVLRNGSQYPYDVVYQANSAQGEGEYTKVSCPGFQDMIFCYGRTE